VGDRIELEEQISNNFEDLPSITRERDDQMEALKQAPEFLARRRTCHTFSRFWIKQQRAHSFVRSIREAALDRHSPFSAILIDCGE